MIALRDVSFADRHGGFRVGQALSGRAILAIHPRYTYFARAYGPEIEALDWRAGAMPTEARRTDLALRTK